MNFSILQEESQVGIYFSVDVNYSFGLISVERLNQTFLQVLKFLPGAPHATRHLFTSEPFSWLDFKLAVEERQCIHFQEELNPYRLNCKDNSCLAKSEDFPSESKKFIYCFPILFLSVSAGPETSPPPTFFLVGRDQFV